MFSSKASSLKGRALRFTANGRSVNSLVRSSWALSSSAGLSTAPKLPSPPAFETAATTSAEDHGPNEAWMIGCSMPRRSHKRVRNTGVHLLHFLHYYQPPYSLME